MRTADASALLSPGSVLKRGGHIPRFSPVAAQSLIHHSLGLLRRWPVRVYDPFCGNGIALCTFQLAYSEYGEELIGSDVNPLAVATTKDNLLIVTNKDEALAAQRDLRADYACTGDERFSRRAQVAQGIVDIIDARLRKGIAATPWRVFEANVFDARQLASYIPPASIDLVLTDPPYSIESKWIGLDGKDVLEEHVNMSLGAMRPLLAPGGVVALAFERSAELSFVGYQKARQVQLKGSRTGYLLQAA